MPGTSAIPARARRMRRPSRSRPTRTRRGQLPGATHRLERQRDQHLGTDDDLGRAAGWGGGPLTLAPIADAQVYGSSVNTNYGTLATIRTRENSGASGTYRSYLKFNVAGTGGSVTGVKLRLFVTDASPNAQGVFAVTDTTWTETGLRWSNAPAVTGTALVSGPAPSANVYVEYTLPATAVPRDGLYTFAIKSTSTNSAIFRSKEATASRPQLVVTLGAPTVGVPTAAFTSIARVARPRSPSSSRISPRTARRPGHGTSANRHPGRRTARPSATLAPLFDRGTPHGVARGIECQRPERAGDRHDHRGSGRTQPPGPRRCRRHRQLHPDPGRGHRDRSRRHRRDGLHSRRQRLPERDGYGLPGLLRADLGAPQGADDAGHRQPRVWRRRGAAYFAYFGAAAGDPAKGYYSFDIGAWHAVVLNSNCTIVSCAAGSAQDTWLRADLAAHPTTCTIAIFHHPRFSSGRTAATRRSSRSGPPSMRPESSSS